jgi:phage terminase large subunit-like protein
LFYADADDDFRDPEVWRKANPNLGVSISEDFLRKECRKAIEQPSFEPAFRRYYLNQWVGASERWISSVSWDMCEGSIGTSIEQFKGRPCYAAIDMSSTQDITALVGIIPRDPDPNDELDMQTLERIGEIDEIYDETELGVDPAYGDIVGDGRIFDVVCRFWLPAERADVRERKDKVPYRKWIEQGHITKTAGGAVNPVAIRREVHRWGNIVDLKEVACDPWNAGEMMMSLEGAGFNVVQIRQGTVSMNGPSKAFMRAVLSQQIRHHANPVLTWMSGNVVVEEAEGGLIKPSKKRSPERIDGIVACIMALSRAMLLREPAGSVYEQRGLRGDDESMT